MPVFELPEEIVFPHASLAEPDGLLAVGGDLSPERLLTAYANGIFPWFNEDDPILWWSPDPRCVLYPNEFNPSKSLRLLVQKKKFEIAFDTNFKEVIKNCATVSRFDQPDTWITDDIMNAYSNLHNLGYAHSVETYFENELVGGLYGVSIGKVFFGESMFFKVPNASKIAFYFLIQKLKQMQFDLVDNQITTPHLVSLGATEISREEFLTKLKKSVVEKSIQGLWEN
jgi:leucyl/phenylalanyl-tRNA---protein transferase